LSCQGKEAGAIKPDVKTGTLIKLMIAVLIVAAVLLMCQGCIPSSTIEEAIANRERVVWKEIETAIHWQTGCPTGEIKFGDLYYLLYTKEEIREALSHLEGMRDMKYYGEIQDCDEFARRTMDFIRLPWFCPGAPFGLIRYSRPGVVAPHMANIFVERAGSSLQCWVVDYYKKGDEFFKMSNERVIGVEM